MFGNKMLLHRFRGVVLGLPAFGQSEDHKSDVTIQALGSFVKIRQ